MLLKKYQQLVDKSSNNPQVIVDNKITIYMGYKRNWMIFLLKMLIIEISYPQKEVLNPSLSTICG